MFEHSFQYVHVYELHILLFPYIMYIIKNILKISIAKITWRHGRLQPGAGKVWTWAHGSRRARGHLRNNGVLSKGLKSQPEAAHTDQMWDNPGIQKKAVNDNTQFDVLIKEKKKIHEPTIWRNAWETAGRVVSLARAWKPPSFPIHHALHTPSIWMFLTYILVW